MNGLAGDGGGRREERREERGVTQLYQDATLVPLTRLEAIDRQVRVVRYIYRMDMSLLGSKRREQLSHASCRQRCFSSKFLRVWSSEVTDLMASWPRRLCGGIPYDSLSLSLRPRCHNQACWSLGDIPPWRSWRAHTNTPCPILGGATQWVEGGVARRPYGRA
jgi:hypothetical protein